MITDITTTEKERFSELEIVIESGLQTFVEVGNALMEIRDNRLYRQQFGTFEDYCRDRWGMARNYANKLIAASEVVMNLGTMVPILPTSERQARPLTSLPPQLQREVWPVVVDTAPNGRITAAHVQSVVDEHLDAALDDEIKTVCRKCGQVYDGKSCPDCKKGMAHVEFNSGDNEWYTPSEFVVAARMVMGGIDLDPASSEVANTVVAANIFYSADNDGLTKNWAGNVWMNPPYDRELVQKFADKLIYHYLNNDVTQAITLTNNSTETLWFQNMSKYASGMCLPKGRVKFWHPEKVSAPLQGQAVLYFGLNHTGFSQHFERFGVVWIKPLINY